MTDLETACRELVSDLESRMSNNREKANLHSVGSDELANLYRGIAIGRARSAKELERALAEHTDLDPDVKHLVEQMEDAT